jgi:hypothetical protein
MINEYGSSYELHVQCELSQAPLVHKQDQKEFEHHLCTICSCLFVFCFFFYFADPFSLTLMVSHMFFSPYQAIAPALHAVAALVMAVSQLLPSNHFNALCNENPNEHLVQVHIMLHHLVLNQRNTHAHYHICHTEPLGLVALTNQAQYIKVLLFSLFCIVLWWLPIVLCADPGVFWCFVMSLLCQLLWCPCPCTQHA